MKNIDAANMWWRSLSINEMKEFEKKYKTIYGVALPSEIQKIYSRESINRKENDNV